MERLTGILRRFQKVGPGGRPDQTGDGTPREIQDFSPFARLAQLIGETEKERDQLKQQELLTRQGELVYGKVLSMLEAYGTSLNRWEAPGRKYRTWGCCCLGLSAGTVWGGQRPV